MVLLDEIMMKPLTAALTILLLPTASPAEVFKCMEGGKAVYSQYQSSDNCTSMDVKSIPKQNVVSPGAEGFSATELDLLHGRKQTKNQLDLQTRALTQQMSPEERAALIQEAIAKGEVVAGMNGEQVIESLGKPSSVEPVTDGQGKERWYYWDGDRIKHHLVLRNDSVVYYYRPPSSP